ncbi:hypothetical protein MTR67_040008, partial [Solanum verrucosum]
MLAQGMMTQANMEVVVPMNPNMGTMATRVKNFTRMNPPEFHGSNVVENPQEFIDEMYKVLLIMELTPVEKLEFVVYQLKGVSQVLFNQWKEERAVVAGPLDWEKYNVSFLDRMVNLAKNLQLIDILTLEISSSFFPKLRAVLEVFWDDFCL